MDKDFKVIKKIENGYICNFLGEEYIVKKDGRGWTCNNCYGNTREDAATTAYMVEKW